MIASSPCVVVAFPCSYVEQMDIHSAGLSVRESLVFSARLRLNSAVTMEEVGREWW